MNDIYRLLQQHLDRQPVGFPEVRGGADLRLLQRLFAPDEARLALYLSFRPAATDAVAAAARAEFAAADAARLLEQMFNKGSIAKTEQDGAARWFLVPLVVGMFEFQGKSLSPDFLKDFKAYAHTLSFGRSLLAAKPPQMRTVPVNKSLTPAHHAAPFHQIRAILEAARPPFVILDCICRTEAGLSGKPCSLTERGETCLALGEMASMAAARGHGREISRSEAAAILEQNEADGLVFQPDGVKEPQFICSCCGCCCGMLRMQKQLPRPVDFWTSAFFAEAAPELCTGCGRCVRRCQVTAVSLGSGGKAGINLNRCIGCGLCVTTCAAGALSLKAKAGQPDPPQDHAALQEEILKNKKSAWGEWLMLLKIMLRLPQ